MRRDSVSARRIRRGAAQLECHQGCAFAGHVGDEAQCARGILKGEAALLLAAAVLSPRARNIRDAGGLPADDLRLGLHLPVLQSGGSQQH